MPYYIYRDKNTELEVEVLRTAVEDSDGNIPYYNVPPTREEAAVLSDEEYDAADWIRVMAKKQKSIGFGARGLGGKGRW